MKFVIIEKLKSLMIKWNLIKYDIEQFLNDLIAKKWVQNL